MTRWLHSLGRCDLLAWLRGAQVPFVVIGGVAVAFLGRPRVTRDIDALVWLDPSRWNELLDVGAEHAICPRIEDALAFAQQARVLLLVHEPSGITLDLSFGALPFEEETLARKITRKVHRLQIPLPTPEVLIIMKAVAHPPRDLADIEGVVDTHPRLNRDRIRQIVQEFSDVLVMPQLAADLEGILAKQKQVRKQKK